MTKDEALTMAINQLKTADKVIQSLCPQGYIHPLLGPIHVAIIKSQEALAQPEQEPVAWADLNALSEQINSVNCGTVYRLPSKEENRQPLYTTPPQRKPLTDEEADEFVRRFARYELIRAIEAAHGIKENT